MKYDAMKTGKAKMKITKFGKNDYELKICITDDDALHFLDVGETVLNWINLDRLRFEIRGFRQMGYTPEIHFLEVIQ